MDTRLVQRTVLLAAAATAAFLAAPGEASAQGKLEEVLARGRLIVGTGSTNPPWHFVDETGAIVGYDVDIAKIIAKGLFDDPEAI